MHHSPPPPLYTPQPPHPMQPLAPQLLPGEQTVIFHAEDNIQNVVENPKDTQLMGWFEANKDQDLIAAGAHDYLYQDFPKRFVWDARRAVWKVHQRYKAIG
ncbi:hypothetical protein F5J12DRAFT_781063 [Pisolithus orientalis]|uniref:uncharacterized protein n=1 Tax=Pisolithus orientalis TaxID=936130 RepID=UPI002224BD6D|nr:uncharacterized protein F5J12DRAFT_781063 [Pisolithus orientalis]KAI6020039.1 hypothetical protein F5J12DRAFT_781063 [Pisolithus orientalis]